MARGYYRRLEDREEPFRKLAKVIADINRPENHPGYEYTDMWPLRKDPEVLPLKPPTPEEHAAFMAELDELDSDLIQL
jgi:hypothetical protein